MRFLVLNSWHENVAILTEISSHLPTSSGVSNAKFTHSCRWISPTFAQMVNNHHIVIWLNSQNIRHRFSTMNCCHKNYYSTDMFSEKKSLMKYLIWSCIYQLFCCSAVNTLYRFFYVILSDHINCKLLSLLSSFILIITFSVAMLNLSGRCQRIKELFCNVSKKNCNFYLYATTYLSDWS